MSHSVFSSTQNVRLKENAARMTEVGNLKSIEYFHKWIEEEAAEVEVYLILNDRLYSHS